MNAAKKTFGREYVEDKIRLRQRRRSDTEDAADADAREKQDKLLLALTSQGFKRAEAKKATKKLAGEARSLSLEELLRRALALLVPQWAGCARGLIPRRARKPGAQARGTSLHPVIVIRHPRMCEERPKP
ncbi:MAG: hypothetical protein H6717_14015 [Polyangiaceae bacterium]|nr:hypothetical protein [Polyangiaceae bacterium]